MLRFPAEPLDLNSGGSIYFYSDELGRINSWGCDIGHGNGSRSDCALTYPAACVPNAMVGRCIKKDARYKQIRVVDANNVYWNRRFFSNLLVG